MSYAGVERGIDDTVDGFEMRDTTGVSATWRGSCFLGKDCAP